MTHHDCACERAGSLPIVGVVACGMCQKSAGIPSRVVQAFTWRKRQMARQLIRKNIQGCVSVQCCCYCICRRKKFVEDDVLVKPLGLVRFAWASGLDGTRTLPCQPPHGSQLKSSITVGESMVLEEIFHSVWTEYWEDRKVMPTKGVPVFGLNIPRMVKPTHLPGI